jgi:hypothetical protein
VRSLTRVVAGINPNTLFVPCIPVTHPPAYSPARLPPQALKDLNPDPYEKQLLGEVIPPDEIGVRFDDIGALESVKRVRPCWVGLGWEGQEKKRLLACASELIFEGGGGGCFRACHISHWWQSQGGL